MERLIVDYKLQELKKATLDGARTVASLGLRILLDDEGMEALKMFLALPEVVRDEREGTVKWKYQGEV